MVNGEVIWKWNCESYSFERFKWYLHYENWYSWWTKSDWQIIWWLTCVIVLISSSHDYDDFLRAMWVFHTSCIFLINIYDDDVYTTAYTPIYSVPFHGTDPHLRMWAAFSRKVGSGEGYLWKPRWFVLNWIKMAQRVSLGLLVALSTVWHLGMRFWGVTNLVLEPKV